MSLIAAFVLLQSGTVLDFKGGSSQDLADFMSSKVGQGVVLPPVLTLPSLRFTDKHLKDFETEQTPIGRLLQANLVGLDPTTKGQKGLRARVWPMEIYPINGTYDMYQYKIVGSNSYKVTQDKVVTTVRSAGLEVQIPKDRFITLGSLCSQLPKPVAVHWFLEPLPVSVAGTFTSQKQLLTQLASTNGAVLKETGDGFSLTPNYWVLREWWKTCSETLSDVAARDPSPYSQFDALSLTFDARLISSMEPDAIGAVFDSQDITPQRMVLSDSVVREAQQLVTDTLKFEDTPGSDFFRTLRQLSNRINFSKPPRAYLNARDQSFQFGFVGKDSDTQIIGWR